MAAKPIPESYHTLTPYLIARGADETIEFLGTTPSAPNCRLSR